MNKNIDLANLLKDCPKGMPLDCAMFDDVTFTGVEKKNKPISIRAGEIYYYLTEFGTWSYDENAKCVIFPKGKTTWEGFQRPFKDGDILYIDCNDDENTNEQYQYTFILKEISDGKIYCYCYIDEANIHKEFEICLLADMRYNPRLATEEEKAELFEVIKDKGYKWNAEEKKLEKLEDNEDKGNISDGYHTFNELYEYRLLYNASMFNELAKQGLYDVHKSKKHSDGTIPFGDENWFIVQAELPTGQISNHYEMKDWDLFQIPEKEKANPYDGHTPQDVAKRLRDFLTLDKSIAPKFKDEDKIHLWTIQDAKEGDVLAINWYEGYDYWEKIIIFKKYHNEGVDSPCVEGYGNTFKNRKLAFHDEVPYFSKTWTACLNPATKEQRDFLFQTIKEAGCKWNPKTKTLEKLIKPNFKDGDIVATNDGKYIAIIKNNGGKYYVCCHPNVNYFNIDRSGWFDRLATLEEKEKLFAYIKENGYEWNEETKTLEKLIVPKFKVGDKIKLKGGDETGIITQVSDHFYIIKCKNNTHYWSIKIQDEWELLVITPKFKVGDIIRSKNGLQIYKITNVTSEYYSVQIQEHDCIGVLPVKDQDDWILIPNRLITEYKIYYTRDSTGEDHHLTFSTQEAMEGCLECMRETNKTCTTYLNIVCKKETVETLDL